MRRSRAASSWSQRRCRRRDCGSCESLSTRGRCGGAAAAAAAAAEISERRSGGDPSEAAGAVGAEFSSVERKTALMQYADGIDSQTAMSHLNSVIRRRMTRHTLLVVTDLPPPDELHAASPLSYSSLLRTACDGAPPTLFVYGGTAHAEPEAYVAHG
mmetsp:Transcript_8612/g.27022  ORF Transcript_8612/g.27022 Transcript_8612/m.27022 type:complete len:157 (-) Transcript_8612:1483-1953(-)